MPRNKHGFLKADALMQGIPDQYAVVKGAERHEVEIRHEPSNGGYVTRHTTITAAVDTVLTWQFGDDLPSAREQFRNEVRSLGGRA